jgi:hypothetical protein
VDEMLSGFTTLYTSYDSYGSGPQYVSNPADYIDVLTFHSLSQWNTYEISVKNNIINSVNDTYTQYYGYIGSSLSNSVFFMDWNNQDYQEYFIYDNYIDSFFELNSIGNYFQSNRIGTQSLKNLIGGLGDNIIKCFSDNFIENLNGNIIGDVFSRNTLYGYISNSIFGSWFDGNYIYVDRNSRFTNNTFGHYSFNNHIELVSNLNNPAFYNNTFGNYFAGSQIYNSFSNNTIGNNILYLGVIKTGNTAFQFNNIKDGVSFNDIDLSLSTHIYNTYNTEIFKRSDNTVRLLYYDSTDTLIITGPNT